MLWGKTMFGQAAQPCVVWWSLGYYPKLVCHFFGDSNILRWATTFVDPDGIYAMEPLGHLAGIGAAIVGSLSTLISMLLGTLIGQNYNNTIFPLVIGMAVLSGLSILVVRLTESK